MALFKHSIQISEHDSESYTFLFKQSLSMLLLQVRFSDINLRIKEHYEEKIAKLRQYEQNLLGTFQIVAQLRIKNYVWFHFPGESRRVMNDAVCAHELVMEKIRHLKTSIEGSNNGAVDTHDNFVDLFLSFHKEVSIVFEEISQWGKEIILFDQVGTNNFFKRISKCMIILGKF